ncbi:hypothetical protein BD311DRAFT_774071 [Dichomitus squalens]|uniref:Uncharacterized protein n=1 Tax=Dichomitus squalens TaxID=114155 RepID=A0A4Q9N4S9_9APHY|nr:hypothetical protein BD311DRAFT_774071 [Dichomitus squalens]
MTSPQKSPSLGPSVPCLQANSDAQPPAEHGAATHHDSEDTSRVPPRWLQPTETGQPLPGSVGPWEALVASEAYNAQGWSTDFVVTTPNAKWVPEIAVAHSEITTFDDGRWGRHEYSRWPQQFTRDAFHIHCIPVKPRRNGPRDVLWRTLCRLDWKPFSCGVVGLGFLDKELEKQLATEVEDAIKRFRKCPSDDKGWNEIGKFLVVCVRHALDRLRSLPAVPGVIISLAAHVQRLTLELYGLIEWLEKVRMRVKEQVDCRLAVLDVLGAYTSDPSVAQMLHRAGVPVWLLQPYGDHLVIYQTVVPRDIPPDFSKRPSYPRLVLAKRDLSGALNLPGEWRRAMTTVVRRQLCDSRLPELLEDEGNGTLPPTKRLREGAAFLNEDSATVGPAAPSFVLQNSRDARALGHDLPAAPSQSSQSASGSSPKQPSRRTRARHSRRAAAAAMVGDDPTGPPKAASFTMNPFRQFYPSQNVLIPSAWATALSKISPLPQPRASVRYFFAPPWLLDALVGFETNPAKMARYLHQWISIRPFCRVRLFDKTVAGRPLTVSEWRDALWGDYDVNEGAEGNSHPAIGRAKVRHERQANVRRLFGKAQSLPSYRVEAQPLFGNSAISYDSALSDHGVQRRVVWEAHETNWRCELLALDALMTGSNEWTELLRWMRESLVSQVWGSGTSGLDVVPPLDGEERPPTFCWLAPPEEGWESSRPYLCAFVEMLERWPGCPPTLQGTHERLLGCNADEFSRILNFAAEFYTRTFVSKYDRLPTIPVRVSLPPTT